jgi:hypothetical protein
MRTEIQEIGTADEFADRARLFRSHGRESLRKAAWHPKLPYHPLCRSRSAKPPELGGAHPSGKIALRPAKSEVVTVCSWQFTGEERLQSTAMILITTENPVAAIGIGTTDRMT